ncbi:MAG: hypothetical protein HY659_03920 [Rhizobiales bacterium]|nr:hypothetical protein [Hyphomicrobiales bacterium]
MKIQVKRLVQFTAAAALATAFVIGTAGIGEAAKKKAPATPPKQAFCTMVKQPVCAEKGKLKFTYANSCYASNDGAKIVSAGACKAPKAKKAKKSKAKKAAKKK